VHLMLAFITLQNFIFVYNLFDVYNSSLLIDLYIQQWRLFLIMWKEFKTFISQGNVLDLVIGVIIGGAFSNIVSYLVDHIIMPVVGLFLGRIDFTSLTFTLVNVQVKYSMFLQNVVDFLIIAISIFIFVKFINTLRKQSAEEEVEETDEQTVLLTEIRDLLKER